jgi:hypothetical protein
MRPSGPYSQTLPALQPAPQAFSPSEQCQKPDKCPDDGLFNFTVVCGVPPGQEAVVPVVVAHVPQDDSTAAGWLAFHTRVVTASMGPNLTSSMAPPSQHSCLRNPDSYNIRQ